MNQGFSRSLRLLNQQQYQAVFDSPDLRISAQGILLLARFNQHEHCRLGLVLGKKNIKLAVQRNRIKRQLREYFRKNHMQLPSMDIVAIGRRGLDQQDSLQLQATLAGLWRRLLKQSKTKLSKDVLAQQQVT